MKQQEGRGAQRGKDKRLLGHQCHTGNQRNAQPAIDQIEQRQHHARIKTLAHGFQVQLTQQAADQLLAELITFLTHGLH